MVGSEKKAAQEKLLETDDRKEKGIERRWEKRREVDSIGVIADCIDRV